MNIISFTGNLGRDVEVRVTPSGVSVANFSVPIKSGYGDNEKTSWVRCSIIGKRAEGGLIQYLKKGQLVGISGELSVNTYTNKEGQEKTSVEVFVKEIDLLGSKNNQSADNFSSAPAQPKAPDDFDGDIPF
jgi:single-strand DNA-binding protein